MSLSNHAEDLLLDYLFGVSVTQPPGIFVALHDGDPGETGANEVTTSEDSAYARKVVTMGASSSGQVLSTSAVTWTAGTVAADFDVTHASIWDTITGGNCLIIGALTATRTITGGTVLTFEIGEILAALD